MTVRCLFITSSYSSRCFRMSKLWASTFFWAFSTALLMRLCSIGSPSSIPSFDMIGAIRSDPKIRSRASSRGREKRHLPGLAGLRDGLGLRLVALGVQNVLGNPVPRKERGETLGLLDGDGPHQDRPLLLVQVLDLLPHGLVLFPPV